MFGVNLVGQTLQGRYRITGKLGEGGFGETYIAIDTSNFDEPCVVKKLKPQNQSTLQWVQQAFEKEARILKSLKHDQIPKLLAYFSEQNDFFLVQEFIDGENLRQRFVPGNNWSENEVIFLLRDILEVLEYVHSKGIIHRDIKPENLMIQKSDGRLSLIDFGAIKEVTTQVFNTQGQLIANTAVTGTPGYMPPEQANGHPMLCSDIYAVGMVGIEALTGVYPVSLFDPQTLEVIWKDKLKIKVRDDLVIFLDKMVNRIPQNRYQSASTALQKALDLSRTVIIITQPPPAPPLKYAGFSTRLVADILDKTILIIASVIFDFITNGTSNSDEFWGRLFVYYIILGFVYATVMESSVFQGTWGKVLLGIVVTDANGNRLTFEQSAKRYFCKSLSYLTIFIGFLMAGFNKKKNTLHDIVSNSLVSRK